MWLLALLLATTSHAAIKVDKKLEGEYGLRCSECVLTAHHAQYTIQDLIQRDERWSAHKWLDQLYAACERRHPDERPMCFAFARQHGDVVARELVELVEDADSTEDSTIATPDAVAKALCAHDGLTGVCPKNAHAFRAKAAGTSNSETQIAVRNARKVGPVEVHEIDINLVDREGCAPSEIEGTDALVYVVRPGEEALIVSSKRQPKAGDAPDLAQTYLRIKPQFAPCGDGTDYYVDRSRRFWALDVSDSRAFDEAAARSETNRPLRVDAATARAPSDPLPAGLPPTKKRRRRRRREL